MNLRGSDIAYNPVFYSYAIVTPDELYVFVENSKLPKDHAEHFEKNNVAVKIDAYENMQNVLKELIRKSQKKVWISSTSSYALSALVPERKLLQEVSPVCVLKSVKNTTEAQGMIDCHIRDGVALCKYFAWLENALNNGEKVDEISGADKLQEFREYALTFFLNKKFELNQFFFSLLMQKAIEIRWVEFSNDQWIRSKWCHHSLSSETRNKPTNHTERHVLV